MKNFVAHLLVEYRAKVSAGDGYAHGAVCELINLPDFIDLAFLRQRYASLNENLPDNRGAEYMKTFNKRKEYREEVLKLIAKQIKISS